MHKATIPVLAAAALSLTACDRHPGQPNGNEPTVAPLAGTPAELQPRAPDAQQLLALERAYADALIRRDRAFLESYYAADWRGGNWMGFWTKATMLKAVLGDRYVTTRVDLRALRVRVLGDIAIVQGISNEVTTVNGQDTSGRWSFTDMFRKRDGRWQAIASHTSELRPE